jgi:hypothetical protein
MQPEIEMRLVTLIAAILALTAAARAEPTDEQKRCAATTDITLDQKLAACTAVIAAVDTVGGLR